VTGATTKKKRGSREKRNPPRLKNVRSGTVNIRESMALANAGIATVKKTEISSLRGRVSKRKSMSARTID
jgi:hypothetical protein